MLLSTAITWFNLTKNYKTRADQDYRTHLATSIWTGWQGWSYNHPLGLIYFQRRFPQESWSDSWFYITKVETRCQAQIDQTDIHNLDKLVSYPGKCTFHLPPIPAWLQAKNIRIILNLIAGTYNNEDIIMTLNMED